MKKLLSMMAIILILLSLFYSMSLPVAAESLYIRKIVSVVYDDSGSMEGDKWAYANYAMQTFCGMLNSDDQLFVTYMSHSQMNSNYKPEEIDLAASGIQNSVDSIRKHTDCGSTPYTAVEIAYNKLKSVKDSNPNTQYWLVVITDGCFDEISVDVFDESERFLNKNFKAYATSKMPNGANPQITFLGIGDVVAPDEDTKNGIYTYMASDANSIIGTMSKMADRISGRTRLGKGDVKKIDDNTIQVSSSIPIMNIAVLAQETDAKIVKAVYSNEVNIPISRSVSLSYPNYSDLLGGAYLVGDSNHVIGSGTYNLTFDKPINLDDVVVLFEPALEMRMTVSVNDKLISDNSQLDNVMEGDKVSVSCKIYEMGTETEISPSLLPQGTTFEISVSEDDKVVKQANGKEMLLSDYTLKSVKTELRAAVVIEGFNPIAYSAEFSPLKYVPKAIYTISSDFGGEKCVKLSDIATNTDMTVCFTVYADGVAITDSQVLKALNPEITVLTPGNDGNVTYSDDGKIVFTPTKANVPSNNAGSFDVKVVCTIDGDISKEETYYVLVSDYQVFALDTTDIIKKTEFFNNQVSVSFYVEKDGKKLNKSEVENDISVSLNEQHESLSTNVVVADDGTITVTPYSTEERKLTFWTWWINWAYYFGLEGDDIVVTLNHAYGSADSTIDVVEEDVLYQILNVYLPLIIELIALIIFTTWIVFVITKPKFLKNATLYVGTIRYNSENGTHTIRSFNAVRLNKFNKLKKGNGRLKFKRTADVVSANGIRIRADHDGRIICEMPFPWYKGRLKPNDIFLDDLHKPSDVAKHIERQKTLEIVEFSTTETISNEYARVLTPGNSRNSKYIVVPNSGNGISIVDERKVIKSGIIFFYCNG